VSKRVLSRVRRNRDYQAIMQWAEDHGLTATLQPPKGTRGHPYLLITDGTTTCKKSVATSSAPNLNIGPVLSNCRRLWVAALERDGRPTDGW